MALFGAFLKVSFARRKRASIKEMFGNGIDERKSVPSQQEDGNVYLPSLQSDRYLRVGQISTLCDLLLKLLSATWQLTSLQ